MLKLEALTLGLMQSNCYILYDSVGCDAVIIDPGAEAERIIKSAEELKVKVRHILLTHAHFDHMGAADIISEAFGCNIIVGREDLLLLTDPVLNLSRGFCEDVTVKCKDIIAVADESLELLGRRFDFISTPGHTNGSLCIKTDDKLFTGDTLFYRSVGNAFPPYGSLEKEIKSIINNIFSIEENCICYPGHGGVTDIEFERQNNPYVNGEQYGY